jgi:hypothetical protein
MEKESTKAENAISRGAVCASAGLCCSGYDNEFLKDPEKYFAKMNVRERL